MELHDIALSVFEMEKPGSLREELARILTLIARAMPVQEELKPGAGVAYQQGFWSRLDGFQSKHGTLDLLAKATLLNPKFDIPTFMSSKEVPASVRAAMADRQAGG
jgi:hypothetical protein